MTAQALRESFKIGTLLSLDWKLGIALKSNKCSALNAAFVTVFLKTVNANNEVSSHSFEMTIPEFQVRTKLVYVFCLKNALSKTCLTDKDCIFWSAAFREAIKRHVDTHGVHVKRKMYHRYQRLVKSRGNWVKVASQVGCGGVFHAQRKTISWFHVFSTIKGQFRCDRCVITLM